MGFRTGSYAKVWQVEDKGNHVRLNMSVSKKNRESGEYETTWSGFVSVVGSAKSDAAKLKAGDRIKIGDVDVTTTYNKERNVTYTNYTMFSFSDADSDGAPRPAPATTASPAIADDDPF